MGQGRETLAHSRWLLTCHDLLAHHHESFCGQGVLRAELELSVRTDGRLPRIVEVQLTGDAVVVDVGSRLHQRQALDVGRALGAAFGDAVDVGRDVGTGRRLRLLGSER